MNPHWGEQIRFRQDNVLKVSMVFQGLDRSGAQAVWQPFLDAVDAAQGLRRRVLAAEDRRHIGARLLGADAESSACSASSSSDDRPGAPESNVFWPGDQGQAGQFLHGYDSTWLPASLLGPSRRTALADALFAASRHWSVSLHVNKGLAGAPRRSLAAARDTAINPAVLDAFALAIIGARKRPAYPGVAGREPDVDAARRATQAIGAGDGRVAQARARPGAYVSESNFFEPRLAAGVLGRELRAAAGGEGALRPGRPVLRAPRRRAASAGAPTDSRVQREPGPAFDGDRSVRERMQRNVRLTREPQGRAS